MGQLNTFYTAIQTRVRAIQSGGVDQFPRVFITPEVDIEPLLAVPRFPCAIITPGSDSIDTMNGKIRTGRFTITVIVMRMRDHVNEQATLDLLDLGDLLITAMEWDNDNSIYNAGVGQLSSLTLDDKVVVGLSYDFAYTIRRT